MALHANSSAYIELLHTIVINKLFDINLSNTKLRRTDLGLVYSEAERGFARHATEPKQNKQKS